MMILSRSLLVFLTMLVCGVLVEACGGAGSSRRIRFAVEVSSLSATDLPNDHGYTVEIREAKLALAALQFFAGDPLFAGTSSVDRSALRRIAALAATPLARAHPGHYQEGEAMAELNVQQTIDLLSPVPTALGQANGVTGRYGSLRLTLAPTAAQAPTISLGGVARKGESIVAFSADLVLSESIVGIAVEETLEGDNQRVRLTVDLAKWIEQIDFSLLVGTSETATLVEGTQAHNGLVRGVRNTAAYRCELLN
jgi:hypothetical protein